MPKISEIRRGERKGRVVDGAIRLFANRGYHGVGLRDIAGEAGVSLGNIYNHFEGKEPLFEAALEHLHGQFAAGTEPLATSSLDCQFPNDIEKLGTAVCDMVARHRDYLSLIYVDIAEFGGVHVRGYYAMLASGFRSALGARARPDNSKIVAGMDPATALTLIYMQYVNYFVVEHLIGAKGHLGLNDDEAVRIIARTFMLGLAPRSDAGLEE